MQLQHLLTDSRKLLFPSTSIFFALDGPRRSGISFIEELYNRDVRAFVISDKNFDRTKFNDAAFIVVKNVLQALQDLAAYHRSQFNLPVIAITGSNGKTIVKEWLFQLLQEEYKVIRSPKSYNSQTGVPLSVWEINNQHTLGIFEAGISLPGEMEKLEKIIRPTIGIFTNLGEPHSEGFESMQKKAAEKLLLFKGSKLLIYCSDYHIIDKEVRSIAENNNSEIQLFTWSRQHEATIRITTILKKTDHTEINFTYEEEQNFLRLPFTDDASIENLVNCICLLMFFNYKLPDIQQRINDLTGVEMRMQLREGINNSSIIDDSYSADLSSLSIALDFLQQQKQHRKHTVIISDILQTGKSDSELYGQVAEMLLNKKISRLIGVGPVIHENRFAFSKIPETVFFSSSAEFKKQLPLLNFNNEAILLKGARIFEFEEISRMLQQKTHQTVLEIDLSAMSHNLKQYQQLLHPGTKLMVMVKASGYGSGSFEIAGLLQFHKVDYLAVAYADEGVELRKAGISLPIMVMNPEAATFEALTKFDLQPELFSFSILESFSGYLKKAGIPHYPVHIKLDTGMHRLGFEPSDIESLGAYLLKFPELKIQSVFSHLSASDDFAQKDFTEKQGQLFEQCCTQLKKITGYTFIRHIANSSGISRYPELHMDMVRLGIGLYGVDANPWMQENLKNVTTLKTTIAQLKTVKAGEYVGYGRKARVETDSLIATVRIGYADGYPRILGNGNGKMIVAGNIVPVVGNVCMDMTMLDVTAVQGLNEGDEVIAFGEALPIWQIAQWANTISYEIMTGISERVKRVYFDV